jgi:hypothetical protein
MEQVKARLRFPGGAPLIRVFFCASANRAGLVAGARVVPELPLTAHQEENSQLWHESAVSDTSLKMAYVATVRHPRKLGRSLLIQIQTAKDAECGRSWFWNRPIIVTYFGYRNF